MKKQRFNPLFDTKTQVIASEPIEATNTVLSPFSKKPMVKVNCAGIPAYYDEENRLIIPIQKN